MIDNGATVIDVGGESTRPFSNPVSVEDELSRVLPVIEKLRNKTDIVCQNVTPLEWKTEKITDASKDSDSNNEEELTF